MVRNKMEQREYIILCLEDSNDWSNATSRRLVMQASQRDPGLTIWHTAARTGCPGLLMDLEDSTNDSAGGLAPSRHADKSALSTTAGSSAG